ncbi:histone-lysine N-methyltransferase SETMAR-like [Acanthaster planci]|uniref:Histone-lysine N-methyltransferase SETMAR-like n=1 Tax=Acanthaster planci TaxID=133434 RepID=A0A8B7XLH8_ACAPL|nr:histone-lysine N-methyltransferase SETMAR-like [Acanthaster planci]
MNHLISPQSTDNVILPAEINFKYTPTHVPGPGLDKHPSEIIYEGCNCVAPSCTLQCPCITRHGANYDNAGHFIKGPSTTESQPVFECNASCKCGPECINRVIQNGPLFPLHVFTTARKGYGLQSPVPIPKDRFVCEYAGEVLTLKEAQKRTGEMKPQDLNFIMVVRESLASGAVITTPIDLTHIGNIGRFINHSCQPNLYLVTVRVDNDIPRVAMFARRDIDAHKELTYSYWGDHAPQAASDETHEGQQSECFCDSENCVGFLPCSGGIYETGM